MKDKNTLNILEIFKTVGSKVWTFIGNTLKAVFTLWFNKKATPPTDWFELPAMEVYIWDKEHSHFAAVFCAWKTWLFMVPSLWLAIVSGRLEPVGIWFWMTSVFFFALFFRWVASRDVFDLDYRHHRGYHKHVEPQYNIYALYIDVSIGIVLWLIGRTIVSLYIFKMNACCNEFLGEQIFFEPPIGHWFARNLTPEAMSAFMNLFPEPMWYTGLKVIDTHIYYRQVTAYVSCYVLYRITAREFCTSVARFAHQLHRTKRKKNKWISKYDTVRWKHSDLTYEQIVSTLKLLYEKYKLRAHIGLVITFWWVFVWIGYWIWLFISSWWSG